MRNWLIRWFEAVSEALSRTPDPDAALPPDAKTELGEWTPEDVDDYHRAHGGQAPPDAPHIEDGGI